MRFILDIFDILFHIIVCGILMGIGVGAIVLVQFACFFFIHPLVGVAFTCIIFAILGAIAIRL